MDGLNYTIGGRDSCNGDSGGPLWIRKKIGENYFGYLVKNEEDFYVKPYASQVGIVSTGTGKDCASLNSPGQYLVFYNTLLRYFFFRLCALSSFSSLYKWQVSIFNKNILKEFIQE